MSGNKIRLSADEASNIDREEFDQMNSERFGGQLVFETEEEGATVYLPQDMATKDHNDAQLLIDSLCGARHM